MTFLPYQLPPARGICPFRMLGRPFNAQVKRGCMCPIKHVGTALWTTQRPPFIETFLNRAARLDPLPTSGRMCATGLKRYFSATRKPPMLRTLWGCSYRSASTKVRSWGVRARPHLRALVLAVTCKMFVFAQVSFNLCFSSILKLTCHGRTLYGVHLFTRRGLRRVYCI